MRLIALATLALLFAAFGYQSANATTRVALVIGNSNYQKAAKLSNPANDASVIASTLQGAGFDMVDLRRDLGAVEMRRALRDFADKARAADIAVVYYAGHGIEIEGTNYLIPVDAILERDIDAFDEAIPMDRLLTVIEPAKQLRLVIMDACRDNPFATSMRRTVASRAIGRGLAKIEPSSPNTLIAYSAKAGSTATDSDAQNSAFTTALVKYLTKPGLDLRRAFGFTRDDVMKATGNRQEPFVYGSLGGDEVALVPALTPAQVTTAASPQAPATVNSDPRHDYELAAQVGTKDAWNSYIAAYPSGFYTELAIAQRSKLRDQDEREAQRKASGMTDAQKSADRPTGPVAVLTPPQQQPALPSDLPRQIQIELRRVGCSTASADDDWSASARKSLTLFNKNAGTSLDVKVASLGALDAVKAKQGRVCPLICAHGSKADGDNCAKIACRSGYYVNDDNECEKAPDKKPAANREDPGKKPPEARKPDAARNEPKRVEAAPAKHGCHPDMSNTLPAGVQPNMAAVAGPRMICN